VTHFNTSPSDKSEGVALMRWGANRRVWQGGVQHRGRVGFLPKCTVQTPATRSNMKVTFYGRKDTRCQATLCTLVTWQSRFWLTFLSRIPRILHNLLDLMNSGGP
jgi:hypothetical protein